MTKTRLDTNELQLDQVLSVIPSGLFLVDLNMRIIYWNHAAERITGFSAKDAVGQHCSFLQGIPCGRGCGLLNPDITKPIIGIPCSVVNKSGERISLLKNVEYLRDDQGQVIGGIESFVDISHQRQLERDLRQQTLKLDRRVQERTTDLAHSEARFRSVLDNMNDLAYIASSDFQITFMNRAMRDLFGDQVGQPCHTVLHKLDKTCPWCPMGDILDNKTVRDERPFCSSRSTYEIIHTPLVSDDGQIQKLAVCRDITGRKQTEDELREANRELDAFAHSISHDLRGLLAPVVTYMDFLKEQYGDVLDPEIIKVMADVERQSERAIALLDDLLDLAQVGRITPAEQSTDVSLIVDEVLDEHRDPKGVQPTIIKQPLPKTWLPEALVYQIFTNLIGNALNYAAKATKPTEVGCREDVNWLVYFVRDHGPGVRPDESESIFDIFFRGVAGRKVRGTGVGLAIIRKIALRCGGTCWVEDTPGGGATFCIAIPKDPAPLPAVDSSP